MSRCFDFSRWSISLVVEKNNEVIIKPVFNIQPKIEPEPPVANVDVDTSAEEETCSRIVLVPKRDFLLGIADLTGEMVSLHIFVDSLVETFWSTHGVLTICQNLFASFLPEGTMSIEHFRESKRLKFLLWGSESTKTNCVEWLAIPGAQTDC